jgi:hypothetical protein
VFEFLTGFIIRLGARAFALGAWRHTLPSDFFFDFAGPLVTCRRSLGLCQQGPTHCRNGRVSTWHPHLLLQILGFPGLLVCSWGRSLHSHVPAWATKEVAGNSIYSIYSIFARDQQRFGSNYSLSLQIEHSLYRIWQYAPIERAMGEPSGACV